LRHAFLALAAIPRSVKEKGMSESYSQPIQLLNGEKLIGLGEAARSLPGYRDNQGMHPSAVWRWIVNGAKGKDGQRVKLEAVRIGNRWLTSKEALVRFSSALTETTADVPQVRSHAATSRVAKKVGEVLQKMGA
jgi:Protein of unknown function (DUF1580)